MKSGSTVARLVSAGLAFLILAGCTSVSQPAPAASGTSMGPGEIPASPVRAVVRDRDVEFFLNHVPKGTAIQIKNAGHLLQIDQPSRVLELIEEFTANLQ